MIVESIIKGLKDEPITLKDETLESTNPYYLNYICVVYGLVQKELVKLGP